MKEIIKISFVVFTQNILVYKMLQYITLYLFILNYNIYLNCINKRGNSNDHKIGFNILKLST